MKHQHFAVLGGDARQVWLARQLAEEGRTVTPLALSDAPAQLHLSSQAHCVLLPMPPRREDGTLFAPLSPEHIPLEEVFAHLRPQQHIFAGRVDPATRALADRVGLTIRDYFLREELTVANAVPTAEGAVQLAMEALPTTIHRSPVLVVGFGRVGQCTAARFAALGAAVTVAARSPAQLALAESMGCTPLPLSRLGACPLQALVVNTVPVRLLSGEILAALGQPVLLELASPPGGFDPSEGEKLGLRCISAPGLPGKVAPAAAARAIRETIFAMLEEDSSQFP